jgi:ABC-type lipoprotein export system ATPase subunit
MILADEPTGNLDSTSSLDVLDLLEELNREGSTIVLITHERDIAQRAARIVEIRDGRIWNRADGVVDGDLAGATR